MKTYTVELNLPPAAASANFRGHTRNKAEPIALYRGDCALRYRAMRIPPLKPPVTIHLEYYLSRTIKGIPIKGRLYPKDKDGARHGAKAAQDALQDAGVIPNDSADYVEIGRTVIYSRAKDHGGRACLVMTLEVE